MTIAVGIYWFLSSTRVAQAVEWQCDAQQQQAPPAPCERSLPPNIWAADQMLPVVSDLLARSPSFRRQCAAIASHANATVAIRLTSRLAPSTRARAEIRHYGSGALRAIIDVPVTRDAPELLAHEFEHVLEQIDGLDLAALEREGKHGVTAAGEGAFETTRAIEAGRAAAGEYFGWDRPPVHAAAPPGAAASVPRAAQAPSAPTARPLVNLVRR